MLSTSLFAASRLSQQIDVSFFKRLSLMIMNSVKHCQSSLRIHSAIDHDLRRHIAKVAVDPRGDSRVDPQTTLQWYDEIHDQ